MAVDYLWEGIDADGIHSFVSREQWERHVNKRPEIGSAFDLTVRAMMNPDFVSPDKNRPDESQRYFRLLAVAADTQRRGYDLIVSVKYVWQPDGV